MTTAEAYEAGRQAYAAGGWRAPWSCVAVGDALVALGQQPPTAENRAAVRALCRAYTGGFDAAADAAARAVMVQP